MRAPAHADHRFRTKPITHSGLLADAEWRHREQRKLTGRLRTAPFRQDACVEDIDYQHPRGLQKATMLDLAACRWVDAHQNVIFSGQTFVSLELCDSESRGG